MTPHYSEAMGLRRVATDIFAAITQYQREYGATDSALAGCEIALGLGVYFNTITTALFGEIHRDINFAH
ncbi:hypothetical protein SAMN04488070_0958 [Pseudidiomarina maritima]|uniref:Uncharacterized protein n=1 Tax=Pseudidiomarina maritima TaxID=519453 RepID=A0A1I6GMT4_9GAMM|nr:hypothetical protein SAMN04488070_0958 [Pseudidiomarina maritima]